MTAPASAPLSLAPRGPARRGDLALLVEEHWDYVLGEGVRERTTVEVCVVTSVTRRGLIKRLRDSWGGELAYRPGRYQWVGIIAKGRVDVEAAHQAARERVYPGTSQPRPFDSVEEAQEFLRPLLREQVPVSSLRAGDVITHLGGARVRSVEPGETRGYVLVRLDCGPRAWRGTDLVTLALPGTA